MIALDNVARRFGDRFLFRGVTLRIGDDEGVAIVGPNGAGKSTLLKIILGTDEPDEGSVVRSRSTTVGYLPQDGVLHTGRTILEEAALAFDDLMAMHGRADEISGEIDALVGAGRGESAEVIALAAELGKIHHHLEHRQGYSLEGRITRVLAGLGFGERDLGRLTDELSGGWQMRLALAKLLLREPTILMLDEPTNHLDLDTLTWLERYLGSYDGTVVIISHDSRFLDTLVRRVVEIDNGRLDEYRANYSRYLEERHERRQILQAQARRQEEQVRRVKDFAERFRYKATKARQVQSRLRALERLERVELADESGEISFDFPPPPPPGRVLLTLEHVRKSYGELTVFEELELQIERNDRIAFLGLNGAGKSTLARIIAGREPIDGGRRVEGHNLVIASYAQHQAEELDPARTVLETVSDVASGETVTRLRTLLGCFLFSGDAVDKTVGVLSGGEKSRLALARMLLAPANLLVLDEPTNHLDLRSKAVLQGALLNFSGSFVIVSHDRDFLEPLVNKVAEFRGGRVTLRAGTVEEYLERLDRERETNEEGEVAPAAAENGQRPAELEKDRRRREADERRERYRVVKPLREELDRIERDVAAAEQRKTAVEAELAAAGTYDDPARARLLSIEYRDLTGRLAGLYERWTALGEQLEAAGEG